MWLRLIVQNATESKTSYDLSWNVNVTKTICIERGIPVYIVALIPVCCALLAAHRCDRRGRRGGQASRRLLQQATRHRYRYLWPNRLRKKSISTSISTSPGSRCWRLHFPRSQRTRHIRAPWWIPLPPREGNADSPLPRVIRWCSGSRSSCGKLLHRERSTGCGNFGRG